MTGSGPPESSVNAFASTQPRASLAPGPRVAQSPRFSSFTSSGFRYLQPTVVQKYYVENCRNRQFISFKRRAVLRDVMTFCTVPASPCCIHSRPSGAQ